MTFSDDNAFLSSWTPNVGLGALMLISLLCFAMLAGSCYLLREEWLLNNRFMLTSCTILDKHMNKNVVINNGSSQSLYSPSFYVRYPAGNGIFKEWTGLTPLVNSRSNAYSPQAWKIDQYTIGHTYPCWYNPDLRTEVALERGYSSFSVVLVVIAFYLFISSIYITIRKYILLDLNRGSECLPNPRR